MSKESKRKLSKAELKRKEEFEILTDKLADEGYTPKHITMGVVKANVLALVIALPFIIPLWLLFFLMGNEFIIDLFYGNLIIAVAFLALTVVHELIHGITWAHFSEDGWKSIYFGFIAEYLTPYCSCNKPMNKKQIILGAFMPTLILGILPCVVSIFTGSAILFAIGALMILGGGGDLLIILKLLRYKSNAKDVLFIDHPYELGTVAFEKH